MNFAIKLKDLREKNNLTQVQLAAKLSVSIGCVGMWESTQQLPKASMLVKIADFFGVTVDELLGREPQSKDLIKRPQYDLSDRHLVDLMKLYEIMTEIQKAHVLGYIIAYLEREGVNVKMVLNY